MEARSVDELCTGQQAQRITSNGGALFLYPAAMPTLREVEGWKLADVQG